MAELRPILAIVGLLVVAGGLLFWIARLRGWRIEWWERFQSPDRARGRPAAAGGAGGGRSGRGASGRPDRSRSRSPAPAGARDSEGAGTDRPGAGPGRQTLIDLEFLPLLNPEDAVEAKPRERGLDREYEVGDLGSVETGEDALGPPEAPAAPTGPRPGKPDRAAGPGPEPARRRGAPPRRPPAGEGSRAEPAEPAPGPRGEGEELLVVLTVLAPGERGIAGPVIREAFAAFDLVPDPQGMFHHYGSRGPSARDPVFTVANVLEPGVFDVEAMDDLATPGLCLFLRRPGPLPAGVAFDLLLDVGARLARALDAVLCDDQRCRLTVQATQALRERVVHFALRHERGGPDAR